MIRSVLTLSVMSLVTLVSFFPEADAANKTSRFRGFDYADFSTFKEDVKKRSEETKIGIKRRISQIFSNPSQERPNFRDQRRSGGGFRFSNRKKVTTENTPSEETNIFKAQNYNFDVLLPASFTVTTDTLSSKQGFLQLTNGSTEVVIRATDRTCPTGVFETQRCFRSEVEELINLDGLNVSQLQRKSNRAILLDLSLIHI